MHSAKKRCGMTNIGYRSQKMQEKCGLCDSPATSGCVRCERPTCSDDFDVETGFCEDCFVEWADAKPVVAKPKSLLEPIVPFSGGMFSLAAVAMFVGAPVAVTLSLVFIAGGALGIGAVADSVNRTVKRRIEKRRSEAARKAFLVSAERKLLSSGATTLSPQPKVAELEHD